MVQLDGTPVELPLLAHMAAALDHRGPDAEGHMVDETVGLYHKRLSIIDVAKFLDEGERWTKLYASIFAAR